MHSDDLHLPRDARHDNVTPTQTRRSPAFSYISKDFRDESTSRAILKLAKNFQTQWRLILMKKFFET